MSLDIKKRIELLKEKCGFETDKDLIIEIYLNKENRGQSTGMRNASEYFDKKKGYFSHCFKGEREFKEEDYLAIESVLNTSMAYILEGKGEIPEDFELYGIRYAAFTDAPGNYEELIRGGILNSSDEYNKTLLDYMIEYKSKNGFAYFAKRNMLPINSTGGIDYNPDSLYNGNNNNAILLKVLCEVLPIDLLLRYFDGFLVGPNLYSLTIDANQNTSFTDEVIGEAIKRADLRERLETIKAIKISDANNWYRLDNEESLGNGLFVNYGLTKMIHYSLKHNVGEEIRIELLEKALELNFRLFSFVSTFEEERLKINANGYITDRHGNMFYGSIAIPVDPSVELSEKSKSLLEKLNRQIYDLHEYISKHSSVSVYANEILADKKENDAYYDFFKVMNSRNIKTIPVFKESSSETKDKFEVNGSAKSKLANSTLDTIKEIVKAIKEIDDISISLLGDKTYYLDDPSIYMLDGKVNYIMPKDVVVSNKYSNLVRLINIDTLLNYSNHSNEVMTIQFNSILKIYGIKKEELGVFLQDFITLSGELAQSIDKTNDWGKRTAFDILSNKAWVEIYQNNIIKNF